VCVCDPQSVCTNLTNFGVTGSVTSQIRIPSKPTGSTESELAQSFAPGGGPGTVCGVSTDTKRSKRFFAL
jgi:hypothetical protein